MKKLLVVLAAGFLLAGTASAGMFGVYGEWMSGVYASGVGGGVAFDLGALGVKAGAHFNDLGLSVGGGVSVPIMKGLMDSKLNICADAEFHYVLSGAWEAPVTGVVEFKLTDNLAVFGGGGMCIFYPSVSIDWTTLTVTTGIGFSSAFKGGVKFSL